MLKVAIAEHHSSCHILHHIFVTGRLMCACEPVGFFFVCCCAGDQAATVIMRIHIPHVECFMFI